MDTASQSLPVRLELTFATSNITAVRSGDGNSQTGTVVDNSGATMRADVYGMVDVIYSVMSDGLMTASD